MQPQPKKKILADDIYSPHLNQYKVLTDHHKVRVVVAGRRFGKSAMAINYALTWILNKQNQVVWIILPEYKQAKSIYWDDPDLSGFFLPYVQTNYLKKNDTELSLVCAKTNSRLVLKGADEPDSLRGSGLDLIIWDEVADIKPTAFDVVSPALADSPHHRVMYMGTPDGYNHFHDIALRGDHNQIIEKAGKTIEPDLDYITYKFTSYDNLTWAEGSIERESFVAYLDKERKKYKEMGQEDWFEQEYMAEFRKRAGAVHKLFSREVHLIQPFEVPLEWRRDRGWDWGSSHPTASIRFATDPDDNWFIELCYKQKDKTIEEHADAIKEQDRVFLDGNGNDPIQGYGDPSGKQWIKELNKLGFNITAAKRTENTEKKTWIEFAIDKINAKIAPKQGHTVFLPDGTRLDNAPSFFIINRTENMPLVDELETLAYKKTDAGLVKTELDDTSDQAGHYDLHASLRYKALSTGSDVSWGGVSTPVAVATGQEVKTSPDLRNEELRAKLEKEADLAIIKQQQQRSGW